MRVRFRILLNLFLLVGLPALVFLPGVGVESAHPALQARAPTAGTWDYTVKPGDVLTVVAQRQLGTFRRYDEILALNPGIKPRALQVGSVLRMPPVIPLPDPPAEAPAPPRRLLPPFLAMLALMALVFAVTGYLERRRRGR
jgi:hypothetical protein